MEMTKGKERDGKRLDETGRAKRNEGREGKETETREKN